MENKKEQSHLTAEESLLPQSPKYIKEVQAYVNEWINKSYGPAIIRQCQIYFHI